MYNISAHYLAKFGGSIYIQHRYTITAISNIFDTFGTPYPTFGVVVYVINHKGTRIISKYSGYYVQAIALGRVRHVLVT